MQTNGDATIFDRQTCSKMATEKSIFVENHKEYVDSFQVLCRHRGEQQQVWVENELMKRLRDAFMYQNPSPKSEFKILAVGANTGSFDTLLIKALFSHAKELVEGKKVTYTVVEPNAVAIDEFKHSVSSQGGVFQNIKFNWINKCMEEFLEAKEPERYDLIQFVHVIYYAESKENVLKCAYEKFLASPGCILTVVVTEENIWRQLIKPFALKIPSLVVNQPTNVELSEVCKNYGWEYETFEGKMDLEVTEVFNEEDPNGQAILKFLFHINENPKEKLGKDIMSEILDFFEKMSFEKSKDGKKHIFVHENDGVLLTYKRP